jgi:hypothetical protein
MMMMMMMMMIKANVKVQTVQDTRHTHVHTRTHKKVYKSELNPDHDIRSKGMILNKAEFSTLVLDVTSGLGFATINVSELTALI